jgi:hypothetical protein
MFLNACNCRGSFGQTFSMPRLTVGKTRDILSIPSPSVTLLCAILHAGAK